jgi:two-component system sensor histidine kinase DegS
MADPPTLPAPASLPGLAERLESELRALDAELGEIEMLITQARTEAGRHEARRAQAADKLSSKGAKADPKDLVEAGAQLGTLTRRAAVMEAQVEVLEGKHKALARHRAAIADVLGRLGALPDSENAGAGGDSRADGPPRVATTDDVAGEISANLPPSVSRVVLNAQEDLRRDIARAMHDGPAQSLTNIVLQAQIVERLIDKDPSFARGETRQLISMVQQTLDATKNFIFDVRPMVLDDLGLVPTLRRSARERGRRAHVPVEFESVGQDRRLPVDVESAVFRMLDEAMTAYLGLGPERLLLRLEWGEVMEARLSAHRTVSVPVESMATGEGPSDDMPDALRQMIEDRKEAHQAAVEAAEEAAIVPLPAATRRDVLARAASIDATVELLGGGGELRLVVPLPAAAEDEER